jgi:antitoxin MazE
LPVALEPQRHGRNFTAKAQKAREGRKEKATLGASRIVRFAISESIERKPRKAGRKPHSLFPFARLIRLRGKIPNRRKETPQSRKKASQPLPLCAPSALEGMVLTNFRSGIYLVYHTGSEGKMQTKIVKWGNSRGIRIPKAFLENLHVAENDPVDITLSDERIIIEKIKNTKHKTTGERLAEFYGENFDQKHAVQKEIDWGRPVGQETW